MLAVCRGKVSEGINFGDAKGRLAIITGIPYPNMRDIWMQVKRRFLDEARAQAIRERSVKQASGANTGASKQAAGSGSSLGSELPPSGGEWYS